MEREPLPRLNPFAFPSDTDFRFFLLILLVIGTSIFFYKEFYLRSSVEADMEAIRQGEPTSIAQIQACAQARDAAVPLDPLTNREGFFAAEEAYGDCISSVYAAEIYWILGGIALLLLIAFVLYWFTPWWKMWRGRYEPLSADDAPDVVAALADLTQTAGLKRAPKFVWNPLNAVSSGLAFGRWGQYYVALTGGLVTQYYTDRPRFDAIVLHELAHLRNADVDKTYFTVSIWYAFLAATFLPWIATRYGTLLFSSVHRLLLLQLIVLAVLVYLTRNGVLRSRELYADLRASTLGDRVASTLGRILASMPAPKSGWWRNALRLHPTPGERRAALVDTRPLFHLGYWEALVVGISITIAFPGLNSLINDLFKPWTPLVIGVLFGLVIAGSVGLNAWRAAFSSLALGERPRGAGRLGLSLGLGIFIGQIFNLFGTESPLFVDADITLTDVLLVLIFNLLWAALLFASLFFIMRWIVASASSWLEIALAHPTPRRMYLTGLTILGVILGLWLGVLFGGYEFGSILLSVGGESEGLLGLFALLLLAPLVVWLSFQSPILFFAFISLWAFPLGVWFFRASAQTQAQSSWAFLDAALHNPTLPTQAAIRPALALKIGLIGGAVGAAVLVTLRLVIRAAVPAVMLQEESTAVPLFIGVLALAALIQAVIAAVATVKIKRLGGIHALFAAFVAGSLIAIAIELALTIVSGEPRFDLFWFNYSQYVNAGAFVSILVVVITSAVLRGLGRR